MYGRPNASVECILQLLYLVHDVELSSFFFAEAFRVKYVGTSESSIASFKNISFMYSVKNAIDGVCDGDNNALTRAFFCRQINALSIFNVHDQVNNLTMSFTIDETRHTTLLVLM